MKSLAQLLTESKWDEDYMKQVITVHLETIYNDGYDNDYESKKALKELIDKGDSDMLDFLISSIINDEEDGVDEKMIYSNYDEFVKLSQDIAKELQ